MKMLVGTGISRAADAYEAGVETARAAISSLGEEAPALVIVFTKPGYDLPVLLAGIRSVTGDAPLVGATGSGEIVSGNYMGFGEGVGVLTLTSGPYRFGVASVENIHDRLDTAGQQLARNSRDAVGKSPHAALLLLADSLLGDLQQLFQGIYRVTGPKVMIIGGGAGDEQKFIETFVFHNDRVLKHAAVAVWIASDEPLQVFTRHGWKPIGVPLLVTRAEGTEIIEIGGRPAADVYEEQLGLKPGTLSAQDFWGTSILHPFGLIQPDGSMVIRVARAKTERGSLRIQGCVPPEGSAVQVMTGTVDSLLDVVDEVVFAALQQRHDPSLLFTFSCAARATIFGNRKDEEPFQLQIAAGDVPTFGFYCCAEFARTSGVLGTHNATLTVLAL